MRHSRLFDALGAPVLSRVSGSVVGTGGLCREGGEAQVALVAVQ